MKKWIIALAVVAAIIVGSVSVAFAAGLFETPAETVANLTGQTADEVLLARQNGAAYGAQAAAAGKLGEFQETRLEQYRLALQEQVAEGRLTQQEADGLYLNMEERMETCDGDGEGIGRRSGGGFGMKNGGGLGGGLYGDGSCLTAE